MPAFEPVFLISSFENKKYSCEGLTSTSYADKWVVIFIYLGMFAFKQGNYGLKNR